MGTTVTTVVDSSLCTGCGSCIRVCPSDTLKIVDGKVAVVGTESMNCGHCQAVCPTGAIRVGSHDPSMLEFNGFTMDRAWLPAGKGGTEELSRLLASRRSCRNYRDAPVPETVLEDLIKVGCLAPSGTNSQKWTFTVIPTREKVLVFGRHVMDFYARLNRMAANPVMRIVSPQLRNYYANYYDSVNQGISEFRTGGRERLFHGASSLIIIACKPGASCPAEDALLASQNIMLAAHTMGYGSCLIGMVVEAAKHDRGIAASVGIPADETIYSVIALGVPDEKWKSVCGRMRPDIRIVTHVA